MNFLRHGFPKLLSDKQTDTTKIIYHAAWRVVINDLFLFPLLKKITNGRISDLSRD